MADNFIRTDGSSGIVVNVYKDTYSLNSAYEGRDGKVNLNWAKRQTGKDQFAEKATPISVKLGEKAEATAALLMILKEITGDIYVINNDVPF
jgi:hypothetical protein